MVFLIQITGKVIVSFATACYRFLLLDLDTSEEKMTRNFCLLCIFFSSFCSLIILLEFWMSYEILNFVFGFCLMIDM